MIESPPGLFLYLKLEDIYHNIPCPHRSGQVRHKRDGSQVKPATNHPIHRPVRDR
ncbi:Uncharacterised protein [Klebsiella pneumoniae]|nr:Uncharacterised protein [Klebsiella pneumoniae]SWJ13032.1 Uncharacterised protein [Klebsiella pneumoniae]SWP83824.1 Uncharacterised protein [Klebsiella pneumoniae]VDB02936.1 hypothetical protein BANRA_05868 [Klebsiella pneumoniae]VDB02943.1 hypothetical protein BANRA_05875 [Klebsiella pneumoniae]